MFQDWKEKIQENPQLSPHLLWDIDQSNMDLDAMKKLIVQRVIERGWENDYYAIFKLYGGIDGVKQIIKELPVVLSPKDEAFVLSVFKLKKEDLQCYIRKQLREKHLNS
jgi:hypothetical protein